ncbi:hypothetical protein Tco_0620959 [Tanacetum coccineum]
MVPRAVLMKSGLVSINTVILNISKIAVLVNTARQVNAAHSKTTINAARPMSYLSKIAHATVKRPIYKNTTFKSSNINQKVNTIRDKKINTARPKAVVNAVKGNNLNAVKASACWAKTIHGEVQLHVLVDGKKIIITESTVRKELQLEDAEGVDCLPNSTIFEQLTLMGSKTTTWNEFSSTMASTIICLATNQKFNFSKYIFESMIRNLDNLSVKFLMYPRLTPLFLTMVVQNQSELGEGLANPTDPHHTPTIIQSSTQPQKTQKPRKPKKKDTQVPQPSDTSENVTNEVVHKELGDSLVMAATTASSLEAEQDSGNITKTRSKATPNESSSLGTTSGGGPRYQETIGDTIAQTRVLDLEKTKTTQQNEIDSLKRRVKKLEKEEVQNEDITMVNIQDDADNEMFDVNALNVSTAATTIIITIEEITLAQALKALKTSKPKVKGIVFQEPGKSTTTTTISSQHLHDKGKGIMIEEHVKPMKKKVQIMLDEEATLKFQAEFDEEERLAREKAEKEKEAIIDLIKEWDDIQAKIGVDYQLSERLQAQEQEELSEAKMATLFQQLLEKRRKHLAAKTAEERRNKPPT